MNNYVIAFLTCLAVLAVAILAFFLALLYCFRKVFFVIRARTKLIERLPAGEQYEKYSEEILSRIRAIETYPFEDIFTTSHDGFKLHAKFFASDDPLAPVEIMFHGYRSNSIRDLFGGVSTAVLRHHNVILVDQRAHGDSEGRCLTFGILERLDCRAWIDYTTERFGADIPIVLSGISMGGATVLMAAGLDLPENVRCIIADCAYSSPSKIIRKVLAETRYPKFFTFPMICLSAKVFGRFDIRQCCAADALKTCKIPVLLIHGEDDRFVPCEMSRECYESCASEKWLVTFPGAGHGLSYIVDERKYVSSVLDFYRQVFRS